MNSRSETSSVRAVLTGIAISALSLTTTINTSGMMFAPPLVGMEKNSEKTIGTSTITPVAYEMKNESGYNQAKELFVGDMRDFTKEEAEKYQDSLMKIYKPIGVNIFDIC